ncbi:MAG: hypothetical protein ACFFDY_13340 [Candidatus Thorarchaeota archaeon]
MSHETEGIDLKMFVDFDKSSKKICINYFIEEFKIEIKTPLKSKDTDTNSLIILKKLDFSNKIFLTSIT